MNVVSVLTQKKNVVSVTFDPELNQNPNEEKIKLESKSRENYA